MCRDVTASMTTSSETPLSSKPGRVAHPTPVAVPLRGSFAAPVGAGCRPLVDHAAPFGPYSAPWLSVD